MQATTGTAQAGATGCTAVPNICLHHMPRVSGGVYPTQEHPTGHAAQHEPCIADVRAWRGGLGVGGVSWGDGVLGFRL